MRFNLLIVFSIIFPVTCLFAQETQPTCANNIGICPNEGCSSDNHHDPKLNVIKNIISNNKPIADRSLSWMRSHKNPKKFTEYSPQGSRGKLTELGEGDQIRTVGYLLAVKPELGGESCNCYLRTVEETDNHLVLVTKETLEKYPLPMNASKSILRTTFRFREKESVTAEFTPRVRKEHPNFTNAKLQPLINKTPQGALLVRITGQLMFDSEHYFVHKLSRVNNWEIHPIFRLEYCPKGKICTATSDENWLDLDNLN